MTTDIPKRNVIFDLDGTLALIDHRRHLVESPNPDWDLFFASCVDDAPNEPIIEVAQSLTERGYDIHVLSGRSDAVAEATIEWLNKHRITRRSLLMRPAGDYTPDDELKVRFIESLGLTPANTLCVFDDRDKVVAMWRRLGFACVQVAPGDF